MASNYSYFDESRKEQIDLESDIDIRADEQLVECSERKGGIFIEILKNELASIMYIEQL